MSEQERTRRLREENEEQRQKIKRLELSLLNADAIEQTLGAVNKKFDEVEERLVRLAGCIGNLESEMKNQKMLIVRAIQQRMGTGPTDGNHN